MPDRGPVTLAPIGAADLGDVGSFLHHHLNRRIPAAEWAASAVPTWAADSSDHGFVLRDDGRVVGVQLAFYSERDVDGEVEQFCNLGAWCVHEDYRAHGVRLLRAVLNQRDRHITDLSPSGNVVAVNRKLGFEFLDTSTSVVPHMPLWPRGGARVVDDLREIESRLPARDLQLFRDHRRARAAIHLMVVRGDEVCYVIARRDRRKGWPVFATVLHVGNPGLLRDHLRLVGTHLLRRHGLVCTLVEDRLLGRPPAGAFRLRRPRPKMFRSGRVRRLQASAVDNLYSELALVAW